MERDRQRRLHDRKPRRDLVPSSAATINVAAEQGNPGLLFNWYRTLIRLKKTVPAFENGANIMLDTGNTRVLSWMRQAPGVPQVVVSVNFTAQPQTVNLTIGGVGIEPRRLKTLLKSPGAADAAFSSSPSRWDLTASISENCSKGSANRALLLSQLCDGIGILDSASQFGPILKAKLGTPDPRRKLVFVWCRLQPSR